MARTTAAKVKAILGPQYDTIANLDLTAFIDTASLMVDQLVECAAAKNKTLSDSNLEVLETWLTAHFYGSADQFQASRLTGRSEVLFQGITNQGLDSTFYGQNAMRLDPSGCLGATNRIVEARVMWLGT